MCQIYFLRHEQRHPKDVSFLSPLTDEGIQNSREKIPHLLTPLQIDVIYSSPYLRTLQTIRPFALTEGLKVQVEWALAEAIYPNDIRRDFQDIVCPTYTSLFPPEQEFRDLTYRQLVQRITRFMQYVQKIHPGKTVLFVTHLPVMNAARVGWRGENVKIYDDLKILVPGSLVRFTTPADRTPDLEVSNETARETTVRT